jgi:hypothetical protein
MEIFVEGSFGVEGKELGWVGEGDDWGMKLIILGIFRKSSEIIFK